MIRSLTHAKRLAAGAGAGAAVGAVFTLAERWREGLGDSPPAGPPGAALSERDEALRALGYVQ